MIVWVDTESTGLDPEHDDLLEGRPRALADVRESIEYLRYYRRAGFVGGGK